MTFSGKLGGEEKLRLQAKAIVSFNEFDNDLN